MNERVYDIDFQKVVVWLTPPVLRKTVLLKWLVLLAMPFNAIYQAFLYYRNAKLYNLLITPQVCYLERLLNDRYDNSLRRIYIDDPIDFPPTYIYQEAELKPVYLGAKYIYTEGESGDMKDDFIVFVPAGLSFEELEMYSLIKQFKLAGTKFKIQRY